MCVGKVNSMNQNVEAPFKLTKKMPKAARKMKLINETGKLQYQEDILAISTHWTKIILFGIADYNKKFQESAFYKILFHTTQPAHFVTALSVILVCWLSIPDVRQSSLESPFWSLIYLGAFSAHFGAQLWMTFVSGLSLYFALPRHTFGSIQQVLFPKYFLMNSLLSLITLSVFFKSHNHNLLKSPELIVQAAGMTVCFLTELVIRLYLTPPLLRLYAMKIQIEKEAGVGMEVGKLVAGDLLKCPHYLKVHKSFRTVHMSIAIGNIVSMACTMLHLYYLSQKLCSL